MQDVPTKKMITFECGEDFPRPRMGRPPQRCPPCRDKRRKAQQLERWLRWAKRQLD